MTPELAQYLETIRRDAKLENSEESAVLNELEAHIEDTVEELVADGHSGEEALAICLEQLGSGKMVARLIYEAHSQGSWRQVLMACTPHLVFGVLFALNWWHYPVGLTIVLLLTLATVVYGWLNGKPNWFFSWLGISLLPVLALGIALLYLPRYWSLVALIVYFPLAGWWIFRIVVETTRRDWIFASMALVPLPIASGWFLTLSPDLTLSELTLSRIELFAPWIGLSFFVLAVTIGIIIRVRQRGFRIGFLVTSGLATLTLVVYYSTGRLDTLPFLGLILVMWGIFLIPPLIERLVRKDHSSLWKSPSRHIQLTPENDDKD